MIQEVVDIAHENAQTNGGKFSVTHSMEDDFKDADIVYPKSWAPMAVMQSRTKFLMKGDKNSLRDLETACLQNNAKYKHWECDEDKMILTKHGEALYMHCLPADISGVSCKSGEVQKEVFEKYRIKTYIEAGYKPYIIAAMILANRFSNPADTLTNIIMKNQKRVF